MVLERAYMLGLQLGQLVFAMELVSVLENRLEDWLKNRLEQHYQWMMIEEYSNKRKLDTGKK